MEDQAAASRMRLPFGEAVLWEPRAAGSVPLARWRAGGVAPNVLLPCVRPRLLL